MTPLALRLNRYQLKSPLLLATLPNDLGVLVPPGVRWVFLYPTMSATERRYLQALAPLPLLAQVLHPTLQRWTQPAQVRLQIKGGDFLGPRLSLAVLGTRPLGYAPVTPVQGVALTLTLLTPTRFDAPKYYASFYG